MQEPALGSFVNSWSNPLNANFGIIDGAVAGVTTVALTNAPVVLTNVQSAFRIILFTGTLTGSVTVTLTSVTGQWVFGNATTGAFTVTVKGSSGDAGIVVPQGDAEDLTCITNVMGFTNVATVAGRQGNVVLAVADVSGAAPLANPALTGAPTAPTQAPGDNTTKIATDAFVTAAIAAQVAKTPQVTVLTTGSGTYTTPAGATYLDITDMIGAGSGGGGSGTGSPGIGTAGTATTFGASLLTANGGPATPANTSTTYPTPATATGGDTNIAGALGAAPNSFLSTNAADGGAPYGASSPLGGGGSPSTITVGAVPIAASPASGFGAGGGAGAAVSVSANYNFGWGGNAAAYLKAIIAAPAATYAYAVGAAGTGGVAGTSGAAGSNGSGGFIRIVAHFQ